MLQEAHQDVVFLVTHIDDHPALLHLALLGIDRDLVVDGEDLLGIGIGIYKLEGLDILIGLREGVLKDLLEYLLGYLVSVKLVELCDVVKELVLVFI